MIYCWKRMWSIPILEIKLLLRWDWKAALLNHPPLYILLGSELCTLELYGFSVVWERRLYLFLFCVSAVLDDEDSNNITAGSIVTVTVTLTRKRMAVSVALNTDIIRHNCNFKLSMHFCGWPLECPVVLVHGWKTWIVLNSLCTLCVGHVWKRGWVNTVSRRGGCHYRGSSKDNTHHINSVLTSSHCVCVRFSELKVVKELFMQLFLVCLCVCVKQADTSKAKTKVWQNKSKGAKKTAKSKKKKLTKKKVTPAPAKAKQANGSLAGNVCVQSQLNLNRL